MGKISVRKRKKRRLNAPYERPNESSVHMEKDQDCDQENRQPEPKRRQTAVPAELRGGDVLEQRSPSALNMNTSALSRGLVSAPALCNNTVREGDLNITTNYFVTQNCVPVTSGNRTSVQTSPDANGNITILRTPKKKRNNNLRQTQRASRLNFDNGMDNCPPALPISSVPNRDGVQPLDSEHSRITGEITGARVDVTYPCQKCRSALPNFRAKTFSIKCSECKQSWKCAKVPSVCVAYVTLEGSDGSKHNVKLSDSLLRTIVTFKKEGHCKAERIEKKVLKVGVITVECINGDAVKVEKVSINTVS